jgi:hypothetical protein
MFSDDQGSWMTMFLVSLVSLFIFSWVYTALLPQGYITLQAGYCVDLNVILHFRLGTFV